MRKSKFRFWSGSGFVGGLLVLVGVVPANGQAVEIMLSTNQISLSEGDTAAYQVRLTSASTEKMRINIRTEHSGIDIMGIILIFTTNNWHMYQTMGLEVSSDAADTNA